MKKKRILIASIIFILIICIAVSYTHLMKTALYVATVARTYRKAIDDYLESPEKYEANMPWYLEQIKSCTRCV